LGENLKAGGNRGAMLFWSSSAEPCKGAFRPALQIDPSAKLLIEALSGRWTYESERPERRTIWYHTANAFLLLVSSLEPASQTSASIKVLSPLDEMKED
jgi:hypothetical protein